MFTRACVCVCLVCIQMGKENIKTAKKSAPSERWAWFFRLIGPGKNGTGEIILRIYGAIVGDGGEEKEENDEEKEEEDDEYKKKRRRTKEPCARLCVYII